MSRQKTSFALTLLTLLGACLVLAMPASAELAPEGMEVLGPEQTELLANLERLPTTATEMDLYTRSQQKLIFRSMSPEARAAFWQGKLQEYLDMHPELNADQVEVIEYGISMMTPHFFVMADGDTPWKAVTDKMIEGFAEVAQQYFDLDETTAIFMRMGTEPTECAPLDKVRRAEEEQADKQFAICDCLYGLDCDYACWSGCQSFSNTGCGWFGGQKCTKYCPIIV